MTSPFLATSAAPENPNPDRRSKYSRTLTATSALLSGFRDFVGATCASTDNNVAPYPHATAKIIANDFLLIDFPDPRELIPEPVMQRTAMASTKNGNVPQRSRSHSHSTLSRSAGLIQDRQ